MKNKITYQCECGLVIELTLKRPLMPGQVLGCFKCNRLYKFSLQTAQSAQQGVTAELLPDEARDDTEYWNAFYKDFLAWVSRNRLNLVLVRLIEA